MMSILLIASFAHPSTPSKDAATMPTQLLQRHLPCLCPLLLWSVGSQGRAGNNNNDVNPRGNDGKKFNNQLFDRAGGQWSWRRQQQRWWSAQPSHQQKIVAQRRWTMGLITGDLGIAVRKGRRTSLSPTANPRTLIPKGVIVMQRGRSTPLTASLHPLLLRLIGLRRRGGNDDNDVNPRGDDDKGTTISFLIEWGDSGHGGGNVNNDVQHGLAANERLRFNVGGGQARLQGISGLRQGKDKGCHCCRWLI
jgi:hypothetical protein